MAPRSETEILIDPVILALIWFEIAPRELRTNRREAGENKPTDIEEDNFYTETNQTIFGEDSSRYPLDFFKSTLLFTTRIRTPFSGKKFLFFRDMLHDQVNKRHHKHLKGIRPLFDDPQYDSFRRGDPLRSRPWDLALTGFNPSELGYRAQDLKFSGGTASTLGQGMISIFRFLNEDESSELLIEDVLDTAWPNHEPVDFSMGFHQFVTDYVVQHQYSFDLPYFSFNDASSWIRNPLMAGQPHPKETIDQTLSRKIDHAVNLTIPEFSRLTFDDIFELRNERFINCYRRIVQDDGFEKLSKTDVDEMIKREMLLATEDAEFGFKELIIDVAKMVLSFLPGSGIVLEALKKPLEEIGEVVEAGTDASSIPSRYRRFKNRWLWFVMRARKRKGDLFKSLVDPKTQNSADHRGPTRPRF